MTKPLILVLDADPMFRESAKRSLLSRDYDVLVAQNGEEAVALLRAGAQPAAIVMDSMMPIMNGWHFLDWLRRSRELKTMPLLVVRSPGWASPTVRHQFSDAAFLPESAQPSSLIQGLGGLLRPRARATRSTGHKKAPAPAPSRDPMSTSATSQLERKLA